MNKKIRKIPDESTPVAYNAFLGTLGQFKAAQVLMKIIGEEYNKGTDYFFVTKHIQYFRYIIIETECIKVKQLQTEIRLFYLRKQQAFFMQLMMDNKITDEIKRFSFNVLISYFRKSIK